jgi:hypothetical protein
LELGGDACIGETSASLESRKTGLVSEASIPY